MNKTHWSRRVAAVLTVVGAICTTVAQAQTPGRFYLRGLSDANAVPVMVNSVSGNTNPFDPAHTVTPGANFDATMALVGYAHTFELFERSAIAAVIVPMGRISGDVTVAGRTFNQTASGFGDPMLEFNINLALYFPSSTVTCGLFVDVLGEGNVSYGGRTIERSFQRAFSFGGLVGLKHDSGFRAGVSLGLGPPIPSLTVNVVGMTTATAFLGFTR